MHIDAFICDAVTIREGLLHVLGAGATALTRREFPAPVAIALGVVLSTERAGTYNISVDIKPDGAETPVGNVTGTVGSAAGDPEDDVVIPFPVGFGGIVIPGPGKYKIEISVDGTLLRTLWFRVREA